MSYHKLLEKQLRKFLPEDLKDHPDLEIFLNAVNESYQSLDRERDLSARAFAIAENEYTAVNKKLKAEVALKKLSIEKLNEAISAITGNEQVTDKSDLLHIARYLSNQVLQRKNAERTFTSLITNLQSGILLESPDRHIIFTNQHFLDLFEIPATPAQLEGTDCSNSAEQVKDLFMDPEKFVAEITELVARRELETGEILELKDGRIFTRDYIPVYTDGAFQGQMWSYTDVTEKKKVQDAIEESERRNRLIMNAALDAIVMMDETGKVAFWNPQAEHIFGWTSAEATGCLLSELIIPKQFRFAHERGLQAYRETGKKSVIGRQLQLQALRKDGSEFPVELYIISVKQDEKEYFCSFIRDVSERQKVKEELTRLSLVASANSNGVLFTTTTGQITWANEGFCNITGFSKEEAMGKTPIELCRGPLSDVEILRKVVNSFFAGEAFSTEVVYYRKDGSWFWGRSSSQPVRNEKGEIVEYFGIIEDITAQKESEKHFKDALEKIGDNVWEHDFETGHTWFSNSNNTLLGYTTSELTDNQRLWWSNIYPADLKLVADNDRKYKSGKMDSHTLEYRMRHRDGSLKWVLDRGVVTLRDKDGIPLRITGTHTDITHIKQTEAELENRLKQFKSLSENIPGVIYEYEFRKDGTEGIRYVSPAIRRIFGIEPDSFVNFHKYVHPDDLPEIVAKNRRSRETLEPFYNESRLLIPGREQIWQSVTSSFSYYTPEGAAVFTGFMLDITERKNAEQKLEAQKRFYEDILNHVPADIAVFSADHRYLFINPRGIKDPELRKWMIGKRDEDYCTYRNKPMSIAEGRRIAFNRMVESKVANEWEEKNILPDGKEQYLLRRWFPVLNEKEEVQLVIGYGVDITERKMFEQALKANEEKYRGIIANMNLGLMELDRDGLIIYVNGGLLKMAGRTEQELIGKAGYSLLPMGTLERRAGRKQVGKGVSHAFEVQVPVKEEERWWLISTAPKFNDEGLPIGWIVVCLDISERKELEKQMIHARENAEQLARTKELFLANMSHEIRTPMNAIMGMSNQLARSQLNEQQRFYLNTIHSAADNLLIIINDILDLSKIEAGKMSLEKIGFEPAIVVEHVMQVLAHKAEEKGIQLTNSFCDARLAPVLLGDPYRLNQVLLNLISNAIKFTDEGTVDITCHVVQDSGDSQTVRCSVTDTGIGMDDEFLKKVFDKFSQEYESVTRRYGGTGLGMSIIKELVGLMGGEVEVESRKGTGTRVSFVVTLDKGTAADLPRKETIEVSTRELEGKKILVVDDNELNRLVATAIVEVFGATTIEAENGKQAVEMVAAHQPDIVLMDIQMPVMNGYDATRDIRNAGNNVPVIALTANAVKGENEKCLDAGMNDYIAKPFKEEEFLKLIAKWLGRNIKTKIVEQPDKAYPELYSLHKLKEISRGNQAFVDKMIRLFLEQVPAAVTEMAEAYKAHELAKLKSIAHRIKPTIDNMEIYPLKNEIREIEALAAKNKPSPRLENLVQLAQDIISKVAADLEQQQ